MLTTFNLDQYVYHAMKPGERLPAQGRQREQLAAAVRTVSAGQALLAPAITRRLIEDFCNGPAPGAAGDGETGRLSERELDVVRLVAQGMSNAEIAAKLYLSEATIKSHIARVLAKLGLRDRVQVAVFAVEKASSGQAAAPEPVSIAAVCQWPAMSALSQAWSERPEHVLARPIVAGRPPRPSRLLAEAHEQGGAQT